MLFDDEWLNNLGNIFLGSADAIITLVNGGANVESHDKDGLTGKLNINI